MFQSRTHTCNELRLANAGETVTLVGWYENLRKVSKNLGFLILRDFYGTTQAVIETEEMMAKLSGVNTESTLSITGVIRERSSKTFRCWDAAVTTSCPSRSTVPRRRMRIPA